MKTLMKKSLKKMVSKRKKVNHQNQENKAIKMDILNILITKKMKS